MNPKSNVVSLHEVRNDNHPEAVRGELFCPNGLPLSVKSWLEAAWNSLSSLPGFKVRKSQVELSFAIANALTEKEKASIAAEAPTGTGKTLAYLLAGLAINQAIKLPVVVGTATVTLQSQVIDYDLPTLIKAGIAKENDLVIAKGRGRYFCVNNAENFIQSNGELAKGGAQTAFEGLESETDNLGDCVKDAESLIKQYQEKSWDGEFDSLKNQGEMRKVWPIVACDSNTCLKKECSYVDECVFWKARDEILNAKVVIANHNLILNDLALVRDDLEKTDAADAEEVESEGKEKGTFKGVFPISGRYVAIFDESHHLPDVAADVGALDLDFEALESDLKHIPQLIDRFGRAPHRALALQKTGLYNSSLGSGPALQKTRLLKQALLMQFPNDGTHRIKASAMEFAYSDKALKDLIDELKLELIGHVQNTAAVLRAALGISRKKDQDIAERTVCGKIANEAGRIYLSIDKSFSTLVTLLQTKDRRVHWFEKFDHKQRLCSAEIEGRPVLKELLWDSPRVRSAGFVSATLVSLGNSFDHFLHKVAAPSDTRTLKLDAIFNYSNSEFHTVRLTHAPGHPQYQEALEYALTDDLQTQKSSLLLFNSRRSLAETYEKLKPLFKDALISQHQMSVQKAVKAHKERIDAGKKSILMGLASMAEGLDLPGAYCNFVGITWLPFTIPTDPRQEALQEMLGAEYFGKIVLPEATVRLIQMVGRLLRREDDQGMVVVYDRRLYSSRYGVEMRKSLPPFNWVARTAPTAQQPKIFSVHKGLLNS